MQTIVHTTLGSQTAQVILTDVESKIMVKRSDLLNRIRDMVVIMNDFQQQHLFKHLPGITIPYYAVGIDEEITQDLRTFFAEMILMATFEYPCWPKARIAGLRMSRLPTLPITLAHWIGKAQHLTQAECDFVGEFCNPTKFVHGQGFCAWGAGLYINGFWLDGAVTPAFMKKRLDFSDETHMVVYDDN